MSVGVSYRYFFAKNTINGNTHAFPGKESYRRDDTLKGMISMLKMITDNLGTIIVSLILILIVAAIIAGMVKKRKQGKSTCGCGCANCAMKGMCHKH